MTSSKHVEESIKSYFNRICENKDVLNLVWEDITALMNKETGKNYKESAYRKRWANYKEGLQDGFRKAIDEDKTLKEYETSLLKIQEEKVKLRDNRTALAQQIRAKARFENIVDELKDAMKDSLEPLIINSPKKNGKESDSVIVAAFSDFHVGSEFEHFFGRYSIEIFKERLEEYVAKIISIGEQNKVSTIKILSLGDTISGIIHVSTRLQNAENVIAQIKIASEYIAQALANLAKHFTTVEYYTALGNHGRV